MTRCRGYAFEQALFKGSHELTLRQPTHACVADAGILRSVGCKGDFYRHALAERIWDLYRLSWSLAGHRGNRGSVK